MKKMALLLLLAAASNSATAQTKVVLQAGTPYTIQSVADAASTGNPVLYQWYRDGSAITTDGTGASYTVPSNLAVGTSVEFKRAAYTATCDEPKYSNTIVITWCNLRLGTTCWADANVAQPGTFVPKPDMHTEFYQWNQPNKAWPSGGNISGTWPTGITAPAWTATPCPEGWRLPTVEEILALHNLTGNVNGRSGYWAASGERGNAVAGRFYGVTSERGQAAGGCTLPGNMVGCIFLSASGRRNPATGGYGSHDVTGYYWSSTQADATNGRRLEFNSGGSYNGGIEKSYGFTIRCVQ